MSENFFSKKLLQQFSLASLTFVTLIGGCIKIDLDQFSLSVTARGLSQDETIIVTNGSNVSISGRSNTSEWSEPQRFERDYREDDVRYLVSISQQPRIDIGGGETGPSDKTCQVVNPSGKVDLANGLVRIECGFELVLADQGGTMTEDSGLLVGVGTELIPLDATTRLTTTLDHTVVGDDVTPNPDDEALQIIPRVTVGATKFETLFQPEEDIYITLRSDNQGCEFAGGIANDNSALDREFDPKSLFGPTVQTISQDLDWIADTDGRGRGRLCGDFPSTSDTLPTTYILDYDASENPGNFGSYIGECFPTASIKIDCGLALSVDTNLSTGIKNNIEFTGSKAGVDAHTVFFTSKRSQAQTFNLAFAETDTYDIQTNFTGVPPTNRTCVFDGTTSDSVSGTFSTENISHTLICTYEANIIVNGIEDDNSDLLQVTLNKNGAAIATENIDQNTGRDGFTFTGSFSEEGADTYSMSISLAGGSSKICTFESSGTNSVPLTTVDDDILEVLNCQ